MVKLTPRLYAAAQYVPKGSVLADIGTDHAYIPAYLIEQGIIKNAFACDINEGPLKNAQSTIKEENLSGVSFVLSDGLKELKNEMFDCILIAGMGGEMIAKIIKDAEWCKNSKYHFIFQPMTKQSFLRQFLYSEGFEICEESLASEKDKIYNIMKVSFCGEKKELSEAETLLGFAEKTELFEIKRANEIKRLNKIALSLKNKEGTKAQIEKINNLIKDIEVY